MKFEKKIKLLEKAGLGSIIVGRDFDNETIVCLKTNDFVKLSGNSLIKQDNLHPQTTD